MDVHPPLESYNYLKPSVQSYHYSLPVYVKPPAKTYNKYHLWCGLFVSLLGLIILIVLTKIKITNGH